MALLLVIFAMTQEVVLAQTCTCMSGNAWGTCADPGGTNPILCRNKCTPAGTTVVNRADCGEVAHLQGTCVKGDTSKTNIFWCQTNLYSAFYAISSECINEGDQCQWDKGINSKEVDGKCIGIPDDFNYEDSESKIQQEGQVGDRGETIMTDNFISKGIKNLKFTKLNNGCWLNSSSTDTQRGWACHFMYPDDGTDPNCLSDKVTPVYDYPTIWGTTLEPYYKPYNELKYYLDMTKELKRSQFILKCFGWIKDISETEAPNNQVAFFKQCVNWDIWIVKEALRSTGTQLNLNLVFDGNPSRTILSGNVVSFYVNNAGDTKDPGTTYASTPNQRNVNCFLTTTADCNADVFLDSQIATCTAIPKIEHVTSITGWKTEIIVNTTVPFAPISGLRIKYKQDQYPHQFICMNSFFMLEHKFTADCSLKLTKQTNTTMQFVNLNSPQEFDHYKLLFADSSGTQCTPMECTAYITLQTTDPSVQKDFTMTCGRLLTMKTDQLGSYEYKVNIKTFDQFQIESNTIMIHVINSLCDNTNSNQGSQLQIEPSQITLLSSDTVPQNFTYQLKVIKNPSNCFDSVNFPTSVTQQPQVFNFIEGSAGKFTETFGASEHALNFQTLPGNYGIEFTSTITIVVSTMQGDKASITPSTFTVTAIQRCQNQLAFDQSKFQSLIQLNQTIIGATQSIVKVADGYSWNIACPIPGLTIVEIVNSASNLTIGSLNTDIVYPSKLACQGQTTTCLYADVSLIKLGSIELEVQTTVNSPNTNIPFNKFTLQVICPPAGHDGYQISFNSSAMPNYYKYLQYTDKSQKFQIEGFTTNYPGCLQINQYSLALKKEKEMISLSLFDDQIKIQCNKLTICNIVRIPKNTFQTIQVFQFYVVAQDTEKNIVQYSDLITVDIQRIPNTFYPLIEQPENVTMFSNQTKDIQLPMITDQDRDEIPIYKQISIDGNGLNFIKFIKATRTLTISPNFQERNSGLYNVTVIVDDQRGFQSTYFFSINITYVEPPKIELKLPIIQNTTNEIAPANTTISSEKNQTTNVKKSEKEESTEPAFDASKLLKISKVNEQVTIFDDKNTNGSNNSNFTLEFQAPDVFARWKVVSINQLGIVKIEFSAFLDLDKINLMIISKTGLNIQVLENQDYRDMIQQEKNEQIPRNLRINQIEVQEAASNYMIVQLEFDDVNEISKGGIEFLDSLFVDIKIDDLFKFKLQSVKNPQNEKYYKVIPRISPFQKGAKRLIPTQIDKSDQLNNLIANSGGSVQSTMSVFMIGSFALNFVISFSMKKLFQAIRVLQMIAFMQHLKINYSPIALFFMEKIYEFATFKIIPPELMDQILIFLGLDQIEGEIKPKSTNDKRILEEKEVIIPQIDDEIEEYDLFATLNSILIGVGVFIVVIIIVTCVYQCLKEKKKLRRRLKHKFKVVFFNGLHQTANNAALPILFTSFNQLKNSIQIGKNYYKMVISLIIVSFLIIYPFLVVRNLASRIKKFYKNIVFFNSHKNSLQGLQYKKIIWSVILVQRRVIYMFILVFMVRYPGIQIIILLLISELMMILFVHFKPFSSKQQNFQESFSEIVIMGFIYHIIMISDMVPFRYKDFRRDASISLISTLMIVLSVFIFMIIQPGISLLIFKSSAKYKKYINRLQQRYDVQVNALLVLFQMDYLVKLQIRMKEIQDIEENSDDISLRDMSQIEKEFIEQKISRTLTNIENNEEQTIEMASKIDENIEKKLNDFYETYCHFESEINILQSYENSDYGMSKEDYKRMTFMQYLLQNANLRKIKGLFDQRYPQFKGLIHVKSTYVTLQQVKKKKMKIKNMKKHNNSSSIDSEDIFHQKPIYFYKKEYVQEIKRYVSVQSNVSLKMPVAEKKTIQEEKMIQENHIPQKQLLQVTPSVSAQEFKKPTNPNFVNDIDMPDKSFSFRIKQKIDDLDSSSQSKSQGQSLQRVISVGEDLQIQNDDDSVTNSEKQHEYPSMNQIDREDSILEKSSQKTPKNNAQEVHNFVDFEIDVEPMIYDVYDQEINQIKTPRSNQQEESQKESEINEESKQIQIDNDESEGEEERLQEQIQHDQPIIYEIKF